MTTLEPKTPPASSVLKVWSDKPPEEVRIFGLRGADIKAIWAPLEVEEPVCPDDRGFTSTNAHGLCKYCQLLLSPSSPGKTTPTIIAHQPSLQALVSSGRQVCSWVEASIYQGCPRLVELYRQGVRGDLAETGVPLNITTLAELDLNGSPDTLSTPDDIRTRLRTTSNGELGKYVALSYCWGPETKYHFTTTSKNIDQYEDGIDFESLPLTQREAVLATLYLGFRYLWIDSLCILQDCPDEWEAEAAKMSAIYANTELTLAATASHNPQGGLPEPLQCARLVPIDDDDDDVAVIRMQTHLDVDSSSEPLNTRAWTLQEAVLSRRIVSFGSNQWLWKCASRYATEDGLEDRPSTASEKLYRAPDAATTTGSTEDGKLYLKHWYNLVCSYSRRELTYQKDKLSAIAGLADICAKQTGFQYILCLWVEDFAAGLMWQATSHGVLRIPGAISSWSWASVSGAVLMPDFSSTDTSMIELLKIEQSSQDIHWASLGPCAPTLLHVRGAQIKVQLGKQALTQELRYHLINGNEILGEAF